MSVCAHVHTDAYLSFSLSLSLTVCAPLRGRVGVRAQTFVCVRLCTSAYTILSSDSVTDSFLNRPVCLSVCLSAYTTLPSDPLTEWSLNRSVCLSVCLSVSLTAPLFTYTTLSSDSVTECSVSRPICLCVCLPVYLCVCLPVCLNHALCYQPHPAM